ncbi:HNH endonuclease [Rossellomorea marisflavi]|uniref:HNH endonuclease n=1 Tax=Rossellomorea marisflavi TaxID=189381 RepID=UPI00345D347D
MLKLPQEVKIKKRGRNNSYYEDKGYIFDKKEIMVNVEHLTKGSHINVLVVCDYCGEEEFYMIYKEFNKKRKKKPNYKDYCQNCKVNNSEARPRNSPVTFERVLNKFNSLDLELFTTKEEFKNGSSPIYYQCPRHKDEGILETTWTGINAQKFICSYCAREAFSEFVNNNYEKMYGSRVLPFELNIDVARENFAEKGYELLATAYKGNHEKMEYICHKHREEGIQLASLHAIRNKRTIHNCHYCYYESICGENSHLWKGGVSTKNKILRDSYKGTEWRNSIYKRDNYTCQCCFDDRGGNLQAHHIENFSENEEKRFSLDNGITMCKNCHDPSVKGSFHNIYGTVNNTKEQLDEYFENTKSGLMREKLERKVFKSGRGKFSDEEVMKIREELRNGSKTVEVAKKYNSEIDPIYNIKAGKTYKHITKGESLIVRRELYV